MESSESDERTPILKNDEPGNTDTQDKKGKSSDFKIHTEASRLNHCIVHLSDLLIVENPIVSLY